MTHVFLISGLGETSNSYGQGARTLAVTLSVISGVKVTRFSYFDDEPLDRAIRNVPVEDTLILIGHSFGGSVCAYMASCFPYREMNLILIDPVPTRAWDRWTSSRIPLTRNVALAVCFRRGRGLYPLAKAISERGNMWCNQTIEGTDHNSVMRAAETHRLIVERVKSFANQPAAIA